MDSTYSVIEYYDLIPTKILYVSDLNLPKENTLNKSVYINKLTLNDLHKLNEITYERKKIQKFYNRFIDKNNQLIDKTFLSNKIFTEYDIDTNNYYKLIICKSIVYINNNEHQIRYNDISSTYYVIFVSKNINSKFIPDIYNHFYQLFFLH